MRTGRCCRPSASDYTPIQLGVPLPVKLFLQVTGCLAVTISGQFKGCIKSFVSGDILKRSPERAISPTLVAGRHVATSQQQPVVRVLWENGNEFLRVDQS